MPGVKGKTNGRPFVKGDPRCGRPKLSEDMRAAKKLTKAAFITAVNKFLGMSRDQITAALQDPNASMLDLMLGGIIAKAVKDGDTVRAGFIIDRLIPRPKFQEESEDPSALVAKKTEHVDVFLVEMNKDGKFLRARPRQLLPDEIEATKATDVIDVTPKKEDGH